MNVACPLCCQPKGKHFIPKVLVKNLEKHIKKHMSKPVDTKKLKLIEKNNIDMLKNMGCEDCEAQGVTPGEVWKHVDCNVKNNLPRRDPPPLKLDPPPSSMAPPPAHVITLSCPRC